MSIDLKECQKRIYLNKKNRNFNVTDISLELLLLQGEINEFFQGYLKQDRENMAEELADVAIYTLGIAEILNIDLGAEILKKIAINEKRIYHSDGSKSLKSE